MKSATKSKTIWIAILTVVLGAVTALTDVLPAEATPYVVMSIGVLNIILRAVTTKPIGL